MQTALRLMAALGSVLAPAMTAQLALVQSAYGQAAPARALPPPPYANAGQPWRDSGTPAYDRYGGETRRAAMVPMTARPAPAPAAARLSWSGKVDGPVADRSAPGADPQARVASMPPRGWSFVPPIGHPAAGQPTLPSSIYDPVPPAAQPQQAREAQANTQGESGPRHYSVHRDYGIEPDPIPLPPQFFGATADLSQPATSDPIRRTTTSGGKSQNPLQPADGQ